MAPLLEVGMVYFITAIIVLLGVWYYARYKVVCLRSENPSLYDAEDELNQAIEELCERADCTEDCLELQHIGFFHLSLGLAIREVMLDKQVYPGLTEERRKIVLELVGETASEVVQKIIAHFEDTIIPRRSVPA